MVQYALVDMDSLITAGLIGGLVFYFTMRIGAWWMDVWHELRK